MLTIAKTDVENRVCSTKSIFLSVHVLGSKGVYRLFLRRHVFPKEKKGHLQVTEYLQSWMAKVRSPLPFSPLPFIAFRGEN